MSKIVDGHRFRADIAGLRALAVLPIVLFHAGVDVLAGGFVGVDIFFVISGFLITGIIARDLERGAFSMVEFYRRRVARIVPALLLVLTTTLIAGAVLMLPTELKDLGSSSAAAAVFSSNFYFLFTTDYFGGAAESKPLLHTWSLAVEEQFYIFFPLAMMGLSRWAPRTIRPALVVASLLSFASALVIGHLRPDASFYMLPTRAWELGIGALIAVGVYPKVEARWLRQSLAGIGLALILIAIFVVRSGPLFPAPLALLPTLGAGLLIAYGERSVVGSLLSTPPMVWIGNISYSLYLWHWPLITFYRLQTGMSLDPAETTGLIAASIALAAITRVILEEPARRNLTSLARGPVALAGAASLVVLAGAAVVLSSTSLQWRSYPPTVLKLAELVRYRDTNQYAEQFRTGVCFTESESAQDFKLDCLRTDSSKANIVVLGDSHAAQYWKAIAERWPDKHVIQATASGCRPLVDTEGAARCTKMVRYVIANILQPGKVQGVVLAGRWQPQEVGSLLETARMIKAQGIPVVVIGPVVEYEGDLPLLLARAALAGRPDDVDEHRLAARRDLDRQLAPKFAAIGVPYVSEYDAECPGDRCLLLDANGDPIHFDYGHLTLEGARIVLERAKLTVPGGRQ